MRPTPAYATTVVALVFGLTGVAGCGSPVTSARLERSMAATVANLFVLQQQRIGAPPDAAAGLSAQASCYRGGPSRPRAGAGDDWRCNVDYTTPQGPTTARFEVQVKTDGCYKADGTPDDVGQALLSDPATGDAGHEPAVRVRRVLRHEHRGAVAPGPFASLVAPDPLDSGRDWTSRPICGAKPPHEALERDVLLIDCGQPLAAEHVVGVELGAQHHVAALALLGGGVPAERRVVEVGPILLPVCIHDASVFPGKAGAHPPGKSTTSARVHLTRSPTQFPANVTARHDAGHRVFTPGLHHQDMPPRPRGHCRVCGDQCRARWVGDVLVAGRHDADVPREGRAPDAVAEPETAPGTHRTTPARGAVVCGGSGRPIAEEHDVDESPPVRHPFAAVPTQRRRARAADEELRRSA